MKQAARMAAWAAVAGWCVLGLVAEATAAKATPYRSPYDLKFSPDGKMIAVSDYTAGALVVLETAGAKVTREVALKGQPAGVAWAPDSVKVYVAERNAGTVAEVDAAAGKVLRRFNVGLRPLGLALAPKRNVLVVANSVTNDVSVVDLATGKEKGRFRVPRDPSFVAVTPDETLAVVANLLPRGSAADPQTSACVSLIELETLKGAADVRLPGGSTSVRQVAVSPDGKWAYAVHTVGRTTLPTTQLERGWVNTNAMSVIDLAGKTLCATLLLDRLSEGAADPWGVVLSKDGKTLWASIAGAHQLARVDLEGLHLLLEGKPLPAAEGQGPRYVSDIWKEIKQDPKKRELLVNDLAALYGAGLLARTPIDGKGPRGIDLAPDGKQVALAVYFSGTVVLADAATGKQAAAVPLGPQRQNDEVRLGESIFHDATYCFQHWLSCATCHPEDGRVDGLNWDLLNDGIGNPKNAKSLLVSHKTPPTMALGVRENMEVAVAAGFRYIQFHEPKPEELKAVEAYLRSLAPEPSPYLAAKGKLSDKAKRGKSLFEGKAGCATCHPAPLYTDLKMYKTGTRYELDRSDDFDTPTLIEIYRTAPYLHSGEAIDLMEVLSKFNKTDQHGSTSKLSKEDLENLLEFLLSL